MSQLERALRASTMDNIVSDESVLRVTSLDMSLMVMEYKEEDMKLWRTMNRYHPIQKAKNMMKRFRKLSLIKNR